MVQGGVKVGGRGVKVKVRGEGESEGMKGSVHLGGERAADDSSVAGSKRLLSPSRTSLVGARALQPSSLESQQWTVSVYLICCCVSNLICWPNH